MSVTPPTSICPYGDSSDDQNVLLHTQIESIPSTRQCSRLKTVAYLLGARQDLPDLVHDSETNRIRAVQSWYSSESSDEQPSEPHPTCYQGPKQPEHLEKGHFFAESDHPLDILNSTRAVMDLPKTYEHLGWCLSTARRTDVPHQLLTSLDISSAFKAARTEQRSGQKKKVVIDIVNTSR
ncbi:uncharacterized protein F5891DRAFT_984523 [Suillus fuscotomentosus]|uniref:Uncharacterized protein n=1 Tax=Suillus fuscotomentosus TaxID=1912939 RepID=A0AAD4DY77_9AGAM|nr:uncharacterized protein F5891DRAFT_984523 [Suillus fuscotomentosus]KAG1895069.1 hypothetical protein F5891DRAFT_984523 [Suillus fuscotomentosus]